MLVLSREKDESIIIGEGENEVEITIVDVRGLKVRLGVNSPRHISVHRKEIYLAIQKEKEELKAQMDKKMEEIKKEESNSDEKKFHCFYAELEDHRTLCLRPGMECVDTYCCGYNNCSDYSIGVRPIKKKFMRHGSKITINEDGTWYYG